MTLRYHPGPEPSGDERAERKQGILQRKSVGVAVGAILISAMLVPFISGVGGLALMETLVAFCVLAAAIFACGMMLHGRHGRRVEKVVRCKLCGRDVDGAEVVEGRKPCIECGG